jgi:ATP-binding cassette subfamily F protein 3
MIKVTDLAKSYGGNVLFQDLNFTINRGERVGLVGRNGSGKTTLFQMVMGGLEPDAGSVSVPAGYRIGQLEQHIRFSRNTVLEEGCRGLPEAEKDDHWKVEKVLSGLGFTREDMGRPPTIFSGGYQLRINLAKLLVSRPDMLLLDEPNNYLDIVAIRWLTGLLTAWSGELMLITHDRHFMDAVTTHTMALHRRRARKVDGGTEKLYNQIALEEEVYEKTRVNDEKRRRQTELFIRRFRAKARLGGLVQSRIKCLAKQEKKEKLEQLETLDFSFNAAPFPAAQMMAVHNLTFSYTGAAPYLVNKLSFAVGKRERICVIGKNGRGKSTLLKLLAGELAALGGTIKTHPLLQTGYFNQTNQAKLNEHKTVFEEIMSVDPEALPQKARNVCGALMFSGDSALKKIGVLSGGERSRVLLGKLLMTPAQLLLLDEPTNHLDMESCDSLIQAIDEFDGSVIMVTHNEMYLHALARKLIVFDQGTATLFDGTYADFLRERGWENEQKTAAAQSGDARPDDRKRAKQKKADLLRERARAVKPMETEIARLEAAIGAAEGELHAATEALIRASVAGEAAAIAAESKKAAGLRPQIETLYDELEKITNTYESRCRQFEERLAAFEGSDGPKRSLS